MPTIPTVTLKQRRRDADPRVRRLSDSAQDTERAVNDSLSFGYRHLDNAAAYQNEDAVGRAIAASAIPREDVFITTKLWIQDAPAEDNTRRAFEQSLTRLGLDHLDLYLIHQPLGDVYCQWRATQALHQQGEVRTIGVSNFYSDLLIDLIDHNETTPAVNQIETHPFFQRGDCQQLMRDDQVAQVAGSLIGAWMGATWATQCAQQPSTGYSPSCSC